MSIMFFDYFPSTGIKTDQQGFAYAVCEAAKNIHAACIIVLSEGIKVIYSLDFKDELLSLYDFKKILMTYIHM